MSSSLIVGLTGGIGSGKSAVCREFEQLNVPVVDADIAAREVVAPGSDGLLEVVGEFGDDVLNSGGEINRSKLRSLIFADDHKRKTLETLLHPRIKRRIVEQLDALLSPYCILCVPLLVERNGYDNIGRILVVDCPVAVQIARVMARDTMTSEQVSAIMQTQATREQRLQMADDVVENAGPLEALKARVEQLHSRYTAIAMQLKPEQ